MVRFGNPMGWFTLLLLFLFVLPANAQFSSGLEGTVHDASGAVIPDARITLTDTRLGVTKTTTASSTGYFRIDSLSASTYKVEISAAGFDVYNEPNLTLQVGEIRTLSP